MTQSASVRVQRSPVPVRFVEGRDELSSIRTSWRTLEERFPSLTGFKFLATFDPAAGWYRACVVRTPGSDAITQDLATDVVPGGAFARMRLLGEASSLYEQLPTAFAALEAVSDVDPDRPRIEYYRRHTEVHALVPVR